MKFAAISDIHGNLAALDAVLADIDGENVDRVVNLGDILSGPLWPSDTADRLMALELPTISGNHERQLLTLAPEAMGPTDRFTTDCLSDRHRAWLAALPPTLALTDDVFLCHGSPASDLVYMLEEIEGEAVVAASPSAVAERLGDCRAPVVLCGHTHIQRRVAMGDGQLVINPGSVGLPAYEDDNPVYHRIETNSPHARYALVEKDEDGWRVELRQIEYDWEGAARAAEDHDRPDWAVALRTGHL